jgi:hypothetical protein
MASVAREDSLDPVAREDSFDPEKLDFGPDASPEPEASSEFDPDPEEIMLPIKTYDSMLALLDKQQAMLDAQKLEIAAMKLEFANLQLQQKTEWLQLAREHS